MEEEEDIPEQIQRSFPMIMQAALDIKEAGKGKDYFLTVCDEVWNKLSEAGADRFRQILFSMSREQLQKYERDEIQGLVDELGNIIR